MTDGPFDSGHVDEFNSRLNGTQTLIAGLTVGAAGFASAMSRAFSQSVTGGKQLDDVLKSVGLRLSSLAVTSALKPVASGLTAGMNSLFSGLFGTAGPGTIMATGGIKPFAAGGVIGTPTYFPLMNGGTGLAGEAGPEAILPLTRGPDGQLGVASAGGRSAGPNVTIHISTPDAESFRRSESYITGQIARAVARGQRNLMPAAFHEVLFPLDIALKSAGGPERRTEIVALGSGREERNARWAHSRRRYDAGYGVKTLEALSAAVAFFEERRGRLYGFRWRDRLDQSSAAPGAAVSAADQVIGTGDGVTATFQLSKTYGGLYAPYQRPIQKPVPGSVRVAVGESEVEEDTAYACDAATGVVTFLEGHVPAIGEAVTAGFLFDVPVRFDTDYLEVDLSAFAAGAIPKIPLLEIKP